MFLTRLRGSLLLSPSLGPERFVVEATGVDMVELYGADSWDDGYGREKWEIELKSRNSILICLCICPSISVQAAISVVVGLL